MKNSSKVCSLTYASLVVESILFDPCLAGVLLLSSEGSVTQPTMPGHDTKEKLFNP